MSETPEPDPVDEMIAVLRETLRANDLILWSASGAHVFNSDTAIEGVARGLLARKVTAQETLDAQPCRYCGSVNGEPPPYVRPMR